MIFEIFCGVYLPLVWLAGSWLRLPSGACWPQCRKFTPSSTHKDSSKTQKRATLSVYCRSLWTWFDFSAALLASWMPVRRDVRHMNHACENSLHYGQCLSNEMTLLIYTVYATFKAGHVPVSLIQRFTLTKTSQRRSQISVLFDQLTTSPKRFLFGPVSKPQMEALLKLSCAALASYTEYVLMFANCRLKQK